MDTVSDVTVYQYSEVMYLLEISNLAALLPA
jgi:hypothetical protein